MRKELPEDPTLSQLFEHYDISGGGVRVVPLTIQEDPKDTRLALVVRGEFTTASLIFAEVMNRVIELSEISEQQEANDEPRIIA